MDRQAIIESYAPYHRFEAFAEGLSAYGCGSRRNPYGDSADAQAWDRGYEAGMRIARALRSNHERSEA